MIYIIEGPDGSGKTTLANYLSQKLNIPIVHRSKPETEEERKNMYQHYLDAIESGKDIIWDRCFYSEMVYGPIMRDKSYINISQMHEYEKKLHSIGCVVFYCTSDVDSLYKRAAARGESYITSKEDFEKIYEGYEILMKYTNHHVPIMKHRIDYCKGFKG